MAVPPDGIGYRPSSLSAAFNRAAGHGLPEAPSARELQIAQERFFAAVQANDVQTVHKFTKAYPDSVSWRNADGLSGLMLAAQEGARETAQVLLEAGAFVEAENANGSTALMFAAYAGKAATAELLIKAGAKVNHVNNKGHTPIMSAAGQGNKNTVKLLADHGADTTIESGEGETALSYAASNGFTEIVETLMRRNQIIGEKGGVRGAFGASAPPPPANSNSNAYAEESVIPEVPPEKAAVYDANTSALKDLERRMGRAKLF